MAIARAVLSVYRKEGLLELARGLQRHNVTLLSSGGTASLLREHGIPVVAISDYTGSPEILGGRVKTMHPKICGGILARPTAEHREEAARHDIPPIDLVVVNLYPFADTVARPGATAQEIVEMIDIGGPTLIRSAAKNHERVSVLVDPADYGALLEEMDRGGGEVTPELRRHLAAKAFAHTAAYDAGIASWFSASGSEDFPPLLTLTLERAQALRYGENPHQRAALYHNPASGVEPSLARCKQLQGKELSHNNILDADAALALVLDLPGTAVGIIKHTNPCGAATNDGDLVQAFRDARATDPVSAFGGIVACNRPVTRELAVELKEMFLEAVIAPGFEPGALEVLAKKKALRLLAYPEDLRSPRGLSMRSVAGGLLVQDADSSVEDLAAGRVVTERKPTAEELRALGFAWRVCKHVKSNAIVFATAGQLVGVGAGQMSRVDSVKLAATKAQLPLAGTVLASDAFFPFRDGVDAAAAAGATAIVQPGGSVRDEEAVAAANEHGLAMVFTGVRHFRH
jgi:phosphoribosylaminoimidazolecarboxamide formyltransferase / IMP cyclohydrolase